MYTIGHSNHQIEKFIQLLKKHGIYKVIDVRSHPYSKHNQQFRKETLEQWLNGVGIEYLFLGYELGGKPHETKCYTEGKADYDKIAQTERFKEGIEKIQNEKKAVLMCSEHDPIDCHRTILICKHLREIDPYKDIRHILRNGNVESHNDFEERILRKTKKDFQGRKQMSLFEENTIPLREEALKQAYKEIEGRIARTLT